MTGTTDFALLNSTNLLFSDMGKLMWFISSIHWARKGGSWNSRNISSAVFILPHPRLSTRFATAKGAMPTMSAINGRSRVFPVLPRPDRRYALRRPRVPSNTYCSACCLVQLVLLGTLGRRKAYSNECGRGKTRNTHYC